MEKNPRSRVSQPVHLGGSTSNLTSPHHQQQSYVQQQQLQLANNGPSGHHSRSERDLTKVTKVRVRTKDTAEAMPTSKQRTKMKTTTMIVNDPVQGKAFISSIIT